jgi:SAM-dependent methyltransferase
MPAVSEPWPLGAMAPDWVPEDVDWRKPSPARVYDAQLGGAHNFEVDREVAHQVTRVMPELPALLRANRSFLRRAVRFLIGRGVTQFLDLGSGIPTVGNVHEVAHAIDPACRVVYVDIDRVAVAHSHRLLAGNPNAVAVRGDLRAPETVLADPAVRATLDFTQPVATLMVAVLHFVADADRPDRIVERFVEEVVPGSYLVLSHGTHAEHSETRSPEETVQQATALYSRTVEPFHLRDRDEVARLFGDLDLVEPGLVPVAVWRPEDTNEAKAGAHLPQLGGVARKP